MAEQSGHVRVLLGRLDNFSEKLLQATVVGENGKTAAQQVLTPFAHGRSDGTELSYVSRGTQKLDGEGLAEEGDGVALL